MTNTLFRFIWSLCDGSPAAAWRQVKMPTGTGAEWSRSQTRRPARWNTAHPAGRHQTLPAGCAVFQRAGRLVWLRDHSAPVPVGIFTCRHAAAGDPSQRLQMKRKSVFVISAILLLLAFGAGVLVY